VNSGLISSNAPILIPVSIQQLSFVDLMAWCSQMFIYINNGISDSANSGIGISTVKPNIYSKVSVSVSVSKKWYQCITTNLHIDIPLVPKVAVIMHAHSWCDRLLSTYSFRFSQFMVQQWDDSKTIQTMFSCGIHPPLCPSPAWVRAISFVGCCGESLGSCWGGGGIASFWRPTWMKDKWREEGREGGREGGKERGREREGGRDGEIKRRLN